MTTAQEIIAKLKKSEGPQPRWTLSEAGRRVKEMDFWSPTRFFCECGVWDVYIDPKASDCSYSGGWLLVDSNGDAPWSGGHLRGHQIVMVRDQLRRREHEWKQQVLLSND